MLRHLVLIGEPGEMIQTPGRQLAEIAEHGDVYGDCDDASVLSGALLGAVGIPVRLVAVGPDDGYRHVFIEGFDGDAWRRLDPVVAPHVDFGGLQRMVVDV